MFLPDPLRRGLDAVRRLERLDLLSQFGNARSLLVVQLMSRTGKAPFELVPQAGQFGQVGVVVERLAEAFPVIAQLRLGYGKILPDAVAFGVVGIGQAAQSVQDGTRPLMLPRQRILPRYRSFEIGLGRELGVENHSEAQAVILP